jgi:site-specific DNA-cytosine methylase
MPTLNAFDNGDVRTTVIVIPIHDKATRFAGKRQMHDGTYQNDGAGNGLGIGEEGDPMNTLTGGDRHAVATLMRMREGKPGGGKGPLLSEDKSLTIATVNDQTLFHKSDVRRLTPVECERLQGFPDDWTAGQSDSARYKQMGNAVAVPVVEWIIQGIVDTLI